MKRSLFRKCASRLFNALMRSLSSLNFDSAITDFMLIDASIVPHIREYRNKNMIFRGIVLDLGFQVAKVYFHEPARLYGESVWSMKKLIKLAIASIVTFSIVPLRLMAYV